MDLLALAIEEITNGYSFDSDTHNYICHVCGRAFEQGEIFKHKERFYDARKMIELHMQDEHFNMLETLMDRPKKYTGLTDNQKKLLSMIADGMTDNEIANQLGVASSTVRHQKYTFREKAKQAKMFLAIYELAMARHSKNKQKPASKAERVTIHRGATMIDDRYAITSSKEEQQINNLFSSLEPLELKTFSVKEKNKIVILRKIVQQFDKDKRYTEKQVNEILKSVYDDFATIRRYMIEYGFMQRTRDCTEYWLANN